MGYVGSWEPKEENLSNRKEKSTVADVPSEVK